MTVNASGDDSVTDVTDGNPVTKEVVTDDSVTGVTYGKPVIKEVVTDDSITSVTYGKSVTKEIVTDDSITGVTYRKPVTKEEHAITIETQPGEPIGDMSVSGPDWLKVGKITLKDEEKGLLYLPNGWLNDRVTDAAQELLKQQFPHILSTAITYSCEIAAKHFLNGPQTDVYRSISKGLRHLNTSAHRLYVV